MKRVRTSSSAFGSNKEQFEKPVAVVPTQVSKYTSTSPDTSRLRVFRCNLPPHEPETFDSHTAYEAHYTVQHSHRCAECALNLPSAYFLELHLAEHHDPFNAVKRDAGEKIHACFVEGCDKVCRDWSRRRLHLIDKHSYPKNYEFRIVEKGIDGRYSLLRPGVDAEGHIIPRRHSVDSTAASTTSSDQASSTGESTTRQSNDRATPTDSVMNDISANMSSLKIVPPSITFGRQKGKTGFSRQ